MNDTSPCAWQSNECKWPLCVGSSDTVNLAPTPNAQTDRAFTLPNIVVGDSELATEIERNPFVILDAILRAARQDWEMELSSKEGEQVDWKKYQESIAIRKHRVELLDERKNQMIAEWAHKVIGGTNRNLGGH